MTNLKIRPLHIIIIIASVTIISGGYFSYLKYTDYKNQKQQEYTQQVEKDRQSQILLDTQQKEKEKQFQTLLDTQQKAINEANKEIDILKKKPAQIITVENKQATTSNTNIDLPSIIEKWRPSVAYIDCTFLKDGKPYIEQSGTGVLFNMLNPQDGKTSYKVMTNKHVVYWKYNGQEIWPVSCSIRFPNNKFTFEINHINETSDESTWVLFTSTFGYDIAYIEIKTPDEYIKSTASQNNTWCGKDIQGKVGDSLVIIGYPSIGSQTDITVTEGIISGIDGDYFITSAKVEHGNSGGAAILLKNNCFLGIPTWADVGTTESLARILRVDVIQK